MAARKSPKMTAKRRNRMKASSFGVSSKRKYPLDTAARARNALARVAQHGTSTEQAQVRKKVRARYPSIAVGGKKRKTGGTRKRKG